MARGGQRQAPAGAYLPNRADMRTTQPIQTAPGQPYGEAGAQAAAQQAMPLANGPAPVPTGAPSAPQMPMPMPGAHGGLFDPTANPNEPVTAGAASGPGPGLEALQAAAPIQNVSTTLAAIAQQTNNPDILALLNRARAEGQ